MKRNVVLMDFDNCLRHRTKLKIVTFYNQITKTQNCSLITKEKYQNILFELNCFF